MKECNREYKEQLYPNSKDNSLGKSILNKVLKDSSCENELNKAKDVEWTYKGRDKELNPSIYDALCMYKLVRRMLGKDSVNMERDFFEEKEDNIKNILRDACNGSKDVSYDDIDTDIKVEIIKGSIYKIKKYFLENDKIKDIRGGSTIIDYLNIDLVKEIVRDSGLEEENIVYCGGGNVLIVTKSGEGRKLCEKLETEYTKIALTVMNAFEFNEVSLKDFLFDFNKVSFEVNKKLEERKKIKVYPVNINNKIEELKITGIESIKLSNYKEKNSFKKERVVCELCTIRDAIYEIKESKTLAVCPSCLRKHLVGAEKNIFANEYEKSTGKKANRKINTIGDIGEKIAVIYGDGNNMGKVVMEVTNVFEMMYFSRKTDKATKNSVYESIAEHMGDYAKFEVIALGGDDIFIIVPAKDAFKITATIIEKFDREFNKKITMSAGIVIASNSTPIASIFKVAQDKLKSAKKYLKKNTGFEEGSVDITRIIGSLNLVEKNRERLFPMENSRFVRTMEELRIFKRKDSGKTSIHKISYAQKNMMEQEFELFYQYQDERNERRLTKLLCDIKNEKNFVVTGSYSPWDDLILMWDLL